MSNLVSEEIVEKELKLLMGCRNGISFIPGTPDLQLLKSCSTMLQIASDSVLKDPDIDVGNLFKYGEGQGDKHFREQLASFLSSEYSDNVKSSNLMVTAGATQGLHAILSILCEKDSPVFLEDPTYFLASRMIKEDLKLSTVPVHSDLNGMVPESLDQVLSSYKDTKEMITDKLSQRFWAAVYLIPVFSNPVGWTYSEERCKQLVQIARKHNVLLIAEDVYNLIYFEDGHPPKRLLSYDQETDLEYAGGHVLSNGTFSKIFAPSLRLGWIEGPHQLLLRIYDSYLTWSGGSFNHYMAKIMSKIISSGALKEHTESLRAAYKKRLEAICKTLDELKPDGWIYQKPKGGFFVWVIFPQNIDALEFLKFAREKFDVSYLPGICCSPTLTSRNCARLSFSCLSEEMIVKGAQKLILAYKNFTSL